MIYTTAMEIFDVSKPWTILVPPDIPAAGTAAADLARCISLLRGGEGGKLPPLMDALGAAPGEDAPIIVLNSGDDKAERSGFTWRLGQDRVEIYGDSGRGLCSGVYDFLAALDIRWPAPGREELPPFKPDGNYGLKTGRAYVSSHMDRADRRRLALSPGEILKNGEALVHWAARNRIDALVLSLRALNRPFGRLRRGLDNLYRAAGKYALIIEAGGRDLSYLVPRYYFFFRRELFRMDSGKRRGDHHFCPTNPGTMNLLKQRAEKFFRAGPEIKVFHLWPDQGGEKAWCSCPNCRAFTPKEQNRIAVNTAADVLAALNPAAALSCFEDPGEDCSIPLRPNLFALGKIPGEGAWKK